MKLYTSQGSMIRGSLFCLFQITVGRIIMRIADADIALMYWIGLAWCLGFTFVMLRIIHAYFTQKPSFEADNDGFSVMGKPKRPWSDYHGARTKGVHVYFIPILRWVIVKTGPGLLGSQQQIHFGHLSEKPKKMVGRMNSFAQKQIAHRR
ncbi:hypothetical protein ACJ5NV_18160 [Loktanella agnita]|uniref:hypothetical protein n=1 Tax=Loktanella agnita TaxID=287097 RepID=UPI003988FF53